MCNIPPVVKQFLAVLSCKLLYFFFNLCIFRKLTLFRKTFSGNIMVYSFGFSNFWTAINMLELKSANSTFPAGQITEHESSTVVAILNLGGLLGNFIVMPLSQIIGIKQTLHTLGLVMIVSILNLEQFKFKIFYLGNNE